MVIAFLKCHLALYVCHASDDAGALGVENLGEIGTGGFFQLDGESVAGAGFMVEIQLNAEWLVQIESGTGKCIKDQLDVFRIVDVLSMVDDRIAHNLLEYNVVVVHIWHGEFGQRLTLCGKLIVVFVIPHGIFQTNRPALVKINQRPV